jgi:hypothetical protein
MGWIEEKKIGKKSGDTVPSRYLDSKFKKVTQEIKHYRYTGTLHIQELVSEKFLQVSCYLPSASPVSNLYECQHAIADSRRLTEMQQPSEHYVCGSVADPDPPDPHIFGPPGSGSTSQMYRYGSGSCSGSGTFYHHAKIVRKNLIPAIL